ISLIGGQPILPAASSSSVADDNRALVLHPRRPFRFDLALAYLQRSPLELLDVVEQGVYRRALEVAGRPRLVEVRSMGAASEPALEVVLADGPASQSELETAAALVARCFRI